jgi:tetratricopeptide (TPR) repeat protein
MLMPFQIALWIRAWHSRQNGLVIALTAQGGLAVVALILTSSRGAWGALAIVLAGWGFWLLSGYVAERMHWPRRLFFGVFVGLVAVSGLLVLLKSMGQVVTLARSVPDADSRYELAYNTLRLIGDFPYTGGGLGAFSGLYSRYMLGISVPLFTYSHDFYLDVALEQGLFGLLALVAMIVGSLALLARPIPKVSSEGLLRWAVMAGILVVSLHGLVEDALYGNQGTPLLLLLVGMAVPLARSPAPQPNSVADLTDQGRGNGSPWPRRVVALTGVTLAAALVFVSWPVVVSAWYANLGAVQMARIELAGWDSVQGLAASDVNALGPAQTLFEQALQLDPGNRTARYRLGLIAAGQDNYQLAVVQMERAYLADPGHRGVTKALGYDYAWLGQIDRAHDLLVTIPEAEHELTTYAWWWKTQGREDRAAYAARLVTLLRPMAFGQLELSRC